MTHDQLHAGSLVRIIAPYAQGTPYFHRVGTVVARPANRYRPVRVAFDTGLPSVPVEVLWFAAEHLEPVSGSIQLALPLA